MAFAEPGNPWNGAQAALLALLAGSKMAGVAGSMTPTAAGPQGLRWTTDTAPNPNPVPPGAATPFSNPNAPAQGNTSFIPGSAANANQVDSYGNYYSPVNNALWTGSYIDPSTFPKVSTTNTQLWGGKTTDSPPKWLQTIVSAAAAMPAGAERTARIQHIMSSLVDPSSGANQYDLDYAERMFGITK